MFIISEAAMNHFGSEELAKKIVADSLQSGADFIKFQIINPDVLYAPGSYEYGSYEIENIRRLRATSSLTTDAWARVCDYGLEVAGNRVVTATAFDLESLMEIVACDPPFLKIASGDNDFFELLDAASETHHKIILSTGMSSVRQIDAAVERILKVHDDLVIMHCVAEYPHHLGESMLGSIDDLKQRYGLEVGFSDHSVGSCAAVLAASVGVRWFEKHTTLSRNNGGVDAKHSMEFSEFEEYCFSVRSALNAFDKKEEPSDAELYTARRARRGLYYADNFPADHLLTEADFLFLRPNQGLSLDQIGSLVGQRLDISVEAFTPASFEHIKNN